MSDVDPHCPIEGQHKSDVFIQVVHVFVVGEVGPPQPRVILRDNEVVPLKVLHLVVEVGDDHRVGLIEVLISLEDRGEIPADGLGPHIFEVGTRALGNTLPIERDEEQVCEESTE